PGKVVADVPQPLTKNLRPLLVGSALEENGSSAVAESESPADDPLADNPLPILPFEPHLAWPSELDVAIEARNCNGCGRCRTQSPDTRMCPIFRIAPAEEASPRAKANLVRAVLTGHVKAEELSTDHT